jgi:hypothetical protein
MKDELRLKDILPLLRKKYVLVVTNADGDSGIAQWDIENEYNTVSSDGELVTEYDEEAPLILYVNGWESLNLDLNEKIKIEDNSFVMHDEYGVVLYLELARPVNLVKKLGSAR